MPTPRAILGDIAGARNNLPYSKEVYVYMRLLEKPSPRVKVFSIGTTEEGREMIAVAPVYDITGTIHSSEAGAPTPIVVNVPMQKGHVVLFANNPIWRGETIGSYFLVFNTILNFDNLNAGRKLDPR